MKDDYIELIQPTPKLSSNRCRISAFMIRIFLQFGTAFATLTAWFLYDYFIAGAALLVSFLVIGIIRSKMRNIAIPQHQREYAYSDDAIAKWFSAKELCVEEAIASSESLSHNAVQKDLKKR